MKESGSENNSLTIPDLPESLRWPVQRQDLLLKNPVHHYFLRLEAFLYCRKIDNSILFKLFYFNERNQSVWYETK